MIWWLCSAGDCHGTVAMCVGISCKLDPHMYLKRYAYIHTYIHTYIESKIQRTLVSRLWLRNCPRAPIHSMYRNYTYIHIWRFCWLCLIIFDRETVLGRQFVPTNEVRIVCVYVYVCPHVCMWVYDVCVPAPACLPACAARACVHISYCMCPLFVFIRIRQVFVCIKSGWLNEHTYGHTNTTVARSSQWNSNTERTWGQNGYANWQSVCEM